MKTRTRIIVGFTAAAALAASVSYPSVARAANLWRSYASYECVVQNVVFNTGSSSGIIVGGIDSRAGLQTAECPLINDSMIALNGSTHPVVHINGSFSPMAGPILVYGCALSSTGANLICGPANDVTSPTAKPITVNSSAWDGVPNDDGLFIFVNTNNTDNSATLWSYDTQLTVP
jgi:hypothetical protein